MFILKHSFRYETKLICDLDQNSFGVHLLYKFYIVYILLNRHIDTFFTRLLYFTESLNFTTPLFIKTPSPPPPRSPFIRDLGVPDKKKRVLLHLCFGAKSTFSANYNF